MSMSETYLFFDIESANCYGGEGHICSFGYVICDSDFNVLEMDDIVMNPEAPFDWYLTKTKTTSRLRIRRNFSGASRVFQATTTG